MLHRRVAPAARGRSPLLALLVLLVVATGAGARPEPAPDRARLVAELKAAYGARDWRRATEVAERLVSLDEKDPLGWYDLACMRSRSGDPEGALLALGRSADLGFDRVATLLRDEDLDAVRGEAAFAAALERVRASGEESLQRFRLRAERDALLVTVLPGGVEPERPAPLLVALHGRGGDASGFAAAVKDLARAHGAVLVAPQGLERSGQGYAWGRLEEGEHLALRAIEQAQKQHRIDPSRIVVLGFSQGAATAQVLGVRHGAGVAAIVALAGGDDPRVLLLPDAAGARLPRFALFAGGDDPSAEEARAFAARLERAGATVWLRIEKGTGHTFPRDRRTLPEAVAFALGEGLGGRAKVRPR